MDEVTRSPDNHETWFFYVKSIFFLKSWQLIKTFLYIVTADLRTWLPTSLPCTHVFAFVGGALWPVPAPLYLKTDVPQVNQLSHHWSEGSDLAKKRCSKTVPWGISLPLQRLFCSPTSPCMDCLREAPAAFSSSWSTPCPSTCKVREGVAEASQTGVWDHLSSFIPSLGDSRSWVTSFPLCQCCLHIDTYVVPA